MSECNKCGKKLGFFSKYNGLDEKSYCADCIKDANNEWRQKEAEKAQTVLESLKRECVFQQQHPFSTDDNSVRNGFLCSLVELHDPLFIGTGINRFLHIECDPSMCPIYQNWKMIREQYTKKTKSPVVV